MARLPRVESTPGTRRGGQRRAAYCRRHPRPAAVVTRGRGAPPAGFERSRRSNSLYSTSPSRCVRVARHSARRATVPRGLWLKRACTDRPAANPTRRTRPPRARRSHALASAASGAPRRQRARDVVPIREHDISCSNRRAARRRSACAGTAQVRASSEALAALAARLPRAALKWSSRCNPPPGFPFAGKTRERGLALRDRILCAVPSPREITPRITPPGSRRLTQNSSGALSSSSATATLRHTWLDPNCRERRGVERGVSPATRARRSVVPLAETPPTGRATRRVPARPRSDRSEGGGGGVRRAGSARASLPLRVRGVDARRRADYPGASRMISGGRPADDVSPRADPRHAGSRSSARSIARGDGSTSSPDDATPASRRPSRDDENSRPRSADTLGSLEQSAARSSPSSISCLPGAGYPSRWSRKTGELDARVDCACSRSRSRGIPRARALASGRSTALTETSLAAIDREPFADSSSPRRGRPRPAARGDVDPQGVCRPARRERELASIRFAIDVASPFG